MATYDWSRFVERIYINASPERVFNAWTQGRELMRWFPIKAESEAKTGGRLYYAWLGDDKLETTYIKVVRNRSIEFPFGSHGEKVRVKFRKKGSGCICELEQFDMKTDPKTKASTHLGCATGWAFFLANLKAYLEHGIDLRSHDPKMSYRQGFVNS